MSNCAASRRGALACRSGRNASGSASAPTTLPMVLLRAAAHHHHRRQLRRIAASAAAPAALATAAPPIAAAAAAEDLIPRGETAGAVMVMEGVTIQVGERDLLTNSDWQIMKGQRIGLVGGNGAGKSTLLRAIVGRLPVASGRVAVAPKVAVGYLEQTAVSGSTRSVWDEARSRMTAIRTAEAEMEAASAAIEAGDLSAAELLADAEDRFRLAGGYEEEKRVGAVLDGLGFSPDKWRRGCDEFSGGWQMRM